MNGRQIDKLLALVQCGRNDSFEELYLGTRRGVYAFLYSYYRNHELTEDAMQSVYLKIKLNIQSYRPGSNGLAWMLEIAKNLAINELKTLHRVEYGLEDGEMEARMAESGETDELQTSEVMDVMKRTLSPEEERIMVLHVIFGYKHREIGKMLDLPIGTVTSKYKRSVEKMRHALSDDGGKE